MPSASCTTPIQVNATFPQMTLTVSTEGGNAWDNVCSVHCVLTYHAGNYPQTNNARAWTVTVDGQTYSGSYDIDGILSGTVDDRWLTVNRGTGGLARTISFSVSVAWNITWSGTYVGTVSASGSVATTNIPQEHTVTYNANGGSGAPASQTKYYGTVLTLTTTQPTRSGYRFLYWNTNSSGTGTTYHQGGQYGADADVTLYAIWERNTYTVSYNANGGSGAPSAQTKTAGVALTLSNTRPTRTGYNFVSWNTQSNGSGTTYQPGGSYTADADVTLYAQWSRITYTISYNANGGSGAPSSQTKYYGTNITLSSTKPTWTGRNFLRWNTAANGSGTNYSPGATYSANASATLYAQWELISYTITYNANGGSGAPNNQTKTYGQTLTLSNTQPTRSDYVFLYWNTSADGNGTTYYPGGSYTANSAVTLYAIWRQLYRYTITYDANTGTGAPSSQTKIENSNINLSSTVPTKSYTITYNANGGSVSPTSKSVACTFVEWNTSASGTGTSYQPGQTYTANANLTLYAIWKNNTAGTLATPTRTNCRFVAWTTTLNGSTQFTSSTVVTSNINIYAKWQYGIIYNGNGGIVFIEKDDTQYTIKTDYKDHGVTYTVPNYSATYFEGDSTGSGTEDDPGGGYTPTPSRTFQGWGLSASTTTVSYTAGNQYTANEPLLLWAVYQTKTFTVIFTDGYSGAVLARYENVAYGSSVTPPADPTRPGYKFIDWLGNYNYIIADTTITAFWGFTPVWIWQAGGWKAYEPTED